MKYKYKSLLAITAFLLVALFCLFLFLYFFPRNPNADHVEAHSRATTRNGLIVIYLFGAAKYLPEYLNRYVELHDTFVHCHSFRFKGKMKAMPLNMMYKNIYKISYKKKLGLFDYMYIYENSLDRPVVITFAFQKHKQLFSTICANVLSANPKAEIDAQSGDGSLIGT